MIVVENDLADMSNEYYIGMDQSKKQKVTFAHQARREIHSSITIR